MLPTSPHLSQIALDILRLNPDGYRDLVIHGGGDAQSKELLISTDPPTLIKQPPKDLDMLNALVCGLWVWNDWLDEAHGIAQKMENDTGAFWHAIIHRRQGDFDNSKHWYARCGNHPVFAAMSNQSALILDPLPADNRILKLSWDGWNSDYFVNLVDKYHRTPDDPFHEILVILQQLEWRVLMEYCAAMS